MRDPASRGAIFIAVVLSAGLGCRRPAAPAARAGTPPAAAARFPARVALAPADAIVNPHDLLTPVGRLLGLARPTPALAAATSAAFLGGDMRMFEPWAELAAAGKLGAPAAPATPHARFFARLLAAPERDAVLATLAFARREHAGLRDPFAPVAAPCDAACRRWLLAYAAGFPDPVQIGPIDRVLGGNTNIDHSAYPDEELIGLCGDYALAEAIPDLERFVLSERRFHLILGDTPSGPSERGQLFRRSLLALVKLALARPAQAPAIRDFLGRTIARFAVPPDLAHPSEPVIREYEDWGEDSAPSRGPSVGREQAMTPEESRVPLLTAAVHALAGDAKAREELGAPRAFPGLAWVQARPDLFTGGSLRRHVASADTLYYENERSLVGLWLASGNVRFVLPLTEIQDAIPMAVSPLALGLSPDGSPVLVAGVLAQQGRHIPTAIIARVDPQSGELTRLLEWPGGDAWKVEALAADAAGVTAGAAGRALRVGWDGRLSWSAQAVVPDHAGDPGISYVRVGAGRAAVVGAGWLELRDRTGTRLARLQHPRNPDIDEPYASGGSDVVLTERTIYFLAGDGGVHALEPDGRERWRRPHAKGDLGERFPARACGASLCVAGDGELSVFTPEGGERKLPLPADLLDFFTSDGELVTLAAGPGDGTGHRADDALVIAELSRPGSRSYRVPAEAEHLLGVTERCVVVELQQAIGCIPR